MCLVKSEFYPKSIILSKKITKWPKNRFLKTFLKMLSLAFAGNNLQ